MRRRKFITLLGGALATMPSATFAQSDRIRLVGLLLSQSEGNAEAKDRIAAVREGLHKLGWIEGRNIRIEVRYANANSVRMRALAVELAQLGSDVLIASATASLAALRNATSTIPIVFAQVTDPVGAGFVKSLARPGGNITGFTQHDFSIGVKWMELLKELAPQTEHIALIYDPQIPQRPDIYRRSRPVRRPSKCNCLSILCATTPILRTLLRRLRMGHQIVVSSYCRALLHQFVTIWLFRLRISIDFLPSIHSATGLRAVDWRSTGSITSSCTGRLRPTWIASSRAKSRATCRFRMRPNSSWLSTSRQPKRLASIRRTACSPALMN